MDIDGKSISENVLDLCRICLSQICGENVSLFHKNIPPYSNITIKIKECTTIKMTEEDGLPSSICLTCANKVIELYKFKKLAKLSDKCLRHINKRKQEGQRSIFEEKDSRTEACHDTAVLIKCDNEVVSVKNEEEEEDSLSSSDENLPLSQLKSTEPLPKRKRVKSLSVKKERKLKAKPFCEKCGVKFIRFSELADHRLSEHKTCDAELEISTSTESLVVYRCHICKEQFSNRIQLRTHCKEVHDVKVIQPYGCSHCPRQFPSWSLVVIHERQHTGEKPYSCDICGKNNFISHASLRRHKLVHDKVYNCKECGKDFNCDSALRAHIRCKHTNEKPYLCNICGRSFSLVAILNAHMTSHSSERKYECDICGFRSKTSGNHHRHRSRHHQSDGTLFPCPTCGKHFDTKLKLSAHSVIHKSERPHVCNVCGKGFIYKNKLETHVLLVHAKERPFSCNVCGRKLASKFGLGIHLKTHMRNGDSVAFNVSEEGKIFNLTPEITTSAVNASSNENNVYIIG